LVLKSDDRKQVAVLEAETVWCEAEAIAYRPLVCECGDVVAVRIHAASRRDDLILDDLRVVIDRVYAVQGRVSRPLGELVQKQKVMSMEAGVKGQRMLSFG
jgi:hypothetical protein